MGRTAPTEFAHRLLAWWDQHGRKNLPWQHPRSPYRVWVSEIMLQQTQVSTVVPYFERWMARFPDLTTLAAASLDEVLRHWAGLGYYARARNLHRAAQECVAEHGGELPATAAGLCSLPGIGLSTANAIISQSADVPAAVLDGNVRRVLARHIALQEWPGSSAGQEKLWQQAGQRLPRLRGADYTQAIMDLGATLCTRSKPNCPDCPVQADCQAFALGLQNQLPLAKPAIKVAQRDVWWLALVDDQSRILLEKRPPAGIWGGLWSLPEAASWGELEQLSGMDLSQAQSLGTRAHRLSHVAMSIHPVMLSSQTARQVVSSGRTRINESAQQQWFGLAVAELPAVPRPLALLLGEIRGRINATQLSQL